VENKSKDKVPTEEQASDEIQAENS